MNDANGSSEGRRAFTLIELLVVISIIGLLIGILTPALSWARRSARRTACLSNLHQIAVGLTAYLDDNNGILPYVLPLSKATNEQDPQDELLMTLRKYFSNTDVFICPADDTGVAEALGTSYDYWPGWIMWAREVFRGESPQAVARLTTVFYNQNPGKWPVMADAEPWHRPLDETGKNASFWDGSSASLVQWKDPKWKN